MSSSIPKDEMEQWWRTNDGVVYLSVALQPVTHQLWLTPSVASYTVGNICFRSHHTRSHICDPTAFNSLLFMDLLQHKKIRMEWYDYSSRWWYFVTICTQDREPYFGEIVDKKMILTELGDVAWRCWEQIEAFHPDCAVHDFICMPDHVHGIIIIGDNASSTLSEIIRGYKIGVTKYAKENNIPFKRQSRFHDRIIRDQQEYENVVHYIQTNPERWTS